MLEVIGRGVLSAQEPLTTKKVKNQGEKKLKVLPMSTY